MDKYYKINVPNDKREYMVSFDTMHVLLDGASYPLMRVCHNGKVTWSTQLRYYDLWHEQHTLSSILETSYREYLIDKILL